MTEDRLGSIEDSILYSRIAEGEGLPHNIHEAWRVEIEWLITELKAARADHCTHCSCQHDDDVGREAVHTSDKLQDALDRIAELERRPTAGDVKRIERLG